MDCINHCQKEHNNENFSIDEAMEQEHNSVLRKMRITPTVMWKSVAGSKTVLLKDVARKSTSAPQNLCPEPASQSDIITSFEQNGKMLTLAELGKVYDLQPYIELEKCDKKPLTSDNGSWHELEHLGFDLDEFNDDGFELDSIIPSVDQLLSEAFSESDFL